MKRLFFFLVFIQCVTGLSSQLIQSVTLSPNPPGNVSDWFGKREIFSYIITNNTGAVRRVVVKAEIKNASGDVIGASNLSLSPTISISGSPVILDAREVFAREYFSFRGSYASALSRTGSLPSENYQLCLQLVTPVDFRPASEVVCRSFRTAAYQPPYPMWPSDELELDAVKAQQAIIFRWTPVSPAPPQPVIYELVVTEVLPHQTPMQAFRSNQPLLVKQITGSTQYIWQPQLNLTTACCGENSGKNNIKKGTADINGNDNLSSDRKVRSAAKAVEDDENQSGERKVRSAAKVVDDGEQSGERKVRSAAKVVDDGEQSGERKVRSAAKVVDDGEIGNERKVRSAAKAVDDDEQSGERKVRSAAKVVDDGETGNERKVRSAAKVVDDADDQNGDPDADTKKTGNTEKVIFRTFVWGVRARTSWGYIIGNQDAGSDGFLQVSRFKTRHDTEKNSISNIR